MFKMAHTLMTTGKQQSVKSSQKFSKGGLNSIVIGLSAKNTTTNGLRKSTGNLSVPLSATGTKSYKTNKSTSDLERIEAEYIKNLQQQVYFLELETNYLREQARKSAELQPQMSSEAKRMLDKLRELQTELDASKLEIKHRESDAEMLKIEHERVVAKLKAAEDSHQKEKWMLLDEIVNLKKEKELVDRTLINKEAQLIDIQQHLEKAESTCRSTENRHRLLESQLNQKEDQLVLLQKTLDDKRVELLKAEDKLHKTEEQYYSSAALVNDRVKEDLRGEIHLLKQKMKEMEASASQGRLLRTKIADDSSITAKENALLGQRIQELKLQLDREHSQKREVLSWSIPGEVARAKDSRSHYQLELEETREQLRRDQLRVKQIMEQIEEQEQWIKVQQVSDMTLQSRVAEAAAKKEAADAENSRLQHDKDALTERVDLLQNQLEEKKSTIKSLEDQTRSLESKLKSLERLQELQSSIHSQKWEEFSRLAESMKTLSHNMIKTTTNQNPRNESSNLLDYS